VIETRPRSGLVPAHPLLADWLVADLSPDERRAAHARLARALAGLTASAPGGSAVAQRIAYHATQAGLAV